MSAQASRRCWSCREAMPIKDRYCEGCGADQWNPPQGAAVQRLGVAHNYVLLLM